MSGTTWIAGIFQAIGLDRRHQVDHSAPSPAPWSKHRQTLPTGLEELDSSHVRVDYARLEALEAAFDARPWASLPDGDRDDELGDLLEWIANATPGDMLDIVSEIRRHYYKTGDREGGDALMQALRNAMKATSMAERETILARYEPYTRYPRLPPFWSEG